MRHPEIAPATWKRYADAVRARAREPGGGNAALLEAHRAANRAELAAALEPEDADAAAALVVADSKRRQASVDTLRVWGGEQIAAIGRSWGVNCWERLAERVDTALERQLPVTTLLRDDAASVESAAYGEVCGAFAVYAVRGGFIDAGRLLDAWRPYFQALYVDRWLQPLVPEASPASIMSPKEREWLSRWRVEWQTKAPLEQRLDAGRRLRSIEGYPADFNLGVLLFDAGRVEEAAAVLTMAGEPEAAKAAAARRGPPR